MARYPEFVRPLLWIVLASVLHADSAAELRAAYPRPFALTELARSAPPEFAARGLLQLLEAGAIPAESWQRDLAREALTLAASARHLLPRRLAPGLNGVDTRAGVIHSASGLGLDALTLSTSAIQQLRRLDPPAAVEAFAHLPRPAPAQAQCKDALLDDVSSWYQLAARLDADPLPILQSLQTHGEIAPAIDLIFASNRSAEQLEALAGALGERLRSLPASGRAWNAAAVDAPAKLAHLRKLLLARERSTAALDDGWRAWMQTGLEAAACQESRNAGPQEQARHDAFDLFNQTLSPALPADLLKPGGEAVAAALEPFADTESTRDQAQRFKQLLFGPNSRALSPAEKDTPEWRERMQSFLQSIERRTRAAEESDVEYFFRQSQLWGSVLMAAPPGPTRDRALQQNLSFLLANAPHIDSTIWFAQVLEMTNISRSLHGSEFGNVLQALHSTAHPILRFYSELEAAYPTRPSAKAN